MENKTYKQYLKNSIATAAFAAIFVVPVHAHAMSNSALPVGENVTHGAAQFSRSGAEMHINQTTDKLIVNWDRFDIGKNATVNFNQPSVNAVGVNRVIGDNTNPTRIHGQLNANGSLVVLDRNGVFYGKDSKVNVHSLITSTGDINTDQFINNNKIVLENISDATVRNRGQITVAERGLAAFVAPNVINDGIITANLGSVQLAGTSNVTTVDLYGDGLLEIAVEEEDLKTSISGKGTITAEAGKVYLTATAADNVVKNIINMNGVIDVSSVEQKGGQIVLSAGNKAGVSTRASLNASSKNKEGGEISVTGHKTLIGKRALLDVSSQKSDAGDIVVSASDYTKIEGDFDANSQQGQSGNISLSGDHRLKIHGKSRVSMSEGGALTLKTEDISFRGSVADFSAQALEDGADVLISVTNDMTSNNHFSWNGSGSLTLKAGNNISFKHSIESQYMGNSVDGGGSLTIDAGNDFSVVDSPRGLTFSTGSGDLSVTAGRRLSFYSNKRNRDMTLSSQKGDITLTATLNDIKLGDENGNSRGADVSVFAKKGNITLNAGDDIRLEGQAGDSIVKAEKGSIIANANDEITLRDRGTNNTVQMLSGQDMALNAENGVIEVNDDGMIEAGNKMSLSSNENIYFNDRSVVRANELDIDGDHVAQEASSMIVVDSLKAVANQAVRLRGENNEINKIGPISTGSANDSNGGITVVTNTDELNVIGDLDTDGDDVTLVMKQAGDVVFDEEVIAADIEFLDVSFVDGQVVQLEPRKVIRPDNRVRQNGPSLSERRQNNINQRNNEQAAPFEIIDVFSTALQSFNVPNRKFEISIQPVPVNASFQRSRVEYVNNVEPRVETVIAEDNLNEIETFAGDTDLQCDQKDSGALSCI